MLPLHLATPFPTGGLAFRDEHSLDGGARFDEALGSRLELARARELSAYHAAYLVLAMREGLPLATLDGRLRAGAEGVGVALVE